MSPTDAAIGFVQKLNEVIIFPLVVLLMAVAVVIFLWGAFEFIAGANNDQAREKGKKHILWGLIGLLVMLSAWAILSLVLNTFNIPVPQNVGTGGGSFAPANSPLPPTPTGAVRPTGGAVTGSPLPTARPGCGYKMDGTCGPSEAADPYDALYEEYRMTGGAALGSTNLAAIQSVPEGGNLERAMLAADELLEYGHITEETHTKLVEKMTADAAAWETDSNEGTEYRVPSLEENGEVGP